jgi:small subunit ribosomal protein S9
MTPQTSSTKQYFYGTGKRKTSIARVRLYQGGMGKVTVNEKAAKEHFSTPFQVENALAPLRLTHTLKVFDVEVEIQGGGKCSQSDAMRHGISRALILANPEMRSELKRAGFLRRDSRVKERKKPGLKGARRAPQWQKR